VIAPLPLRRGGRIGICAPAGPVADERLRAAVVALEADGYGVDVAPSAFGRNGLFSAPDEVRRRELEQMFARPDVDAVFCARGGVGSSRLLPLLNSAAISQSRKPFLGFSDITALQWLLSGRHGLVTFSGPLAVEWDGGVSEETRRRAFDMLEGKASRDLLTDFPRDRLRVLRGSRATGRLMPGNLTMIATLLGTPYVPALDGAILLIEDVGEPPYRIDRLLFHLRNAGVFDRIGALLAGDFGLESAEDVQTVERSLLEATLGVDFPVAIGLPYGHGPDRITVPVGVTAKFDSENGTLSLLHAPIWVPSA